MHGCSKCMGICGVLLLLIGVAFLLVDLGKWTFWNISWYTIVFLLAGIGHIGMSTCKSCQTAIKKKK